MNVPMIAWVGTAALGAGAVASTMFTGSPVLGGVLALAAAVPPLTLRMANQWEEAIVLRFGKHVATRKGGLFAVVPFIDEVAEFVDTRVRTTGIRADNALTRDTVTVNVDAVVFWNVHDTERAVFEVEDYEDAVAWAAQTTLREMIGASDLGTLMSDRKACDEVLATAMKEKIGDWGIEVSSVEIRDVAIPKDLQDAMSRQAQATRERAARVILADGEIEIAEKTVTAASIYARNPGAMQLRQMNTLYEMQKHRGATVIVPSSMVDGFGGQVATAAAMGHAADAAGEGDKPTPQGTAKDA